MISDSDIDALKHYFKNRKDVAFAFLFGSHARGTATKLSDIDIAVYFYPEKRHPIEYEEEVFYNGEDEIWTDLGRLLKKEVEVLVLNRVSASVAASAIRGIPLAINDWGLYLDFMEVITHEAEDFMEMALADFMERRKFEKRTQKASAETL
ncbi:MAG: nucleotidyltransferase domain-containing protein [Thermodesulfovibrionales bacterium]|nr:nucleotidyltransferase domain-containing protein [Thermodesulfovibrionales bacterium]